MAGPDYEYRYNELKDWVLRYLSEMDNPVPDYSYRRTVRNHIRVLVAAPDEPKPRRAVAVTNGVRQMNGDEA